MTGPSRDTWYDATESDRLRYQQGLQRIVKRVRDVLESDGPHPSVRGLADSVLFEALSALGELR